MIDFSGRAVRAGTRSIAVVAAASCFAVMPQVAHHEPAHADGIVGSAARKHDHKALRRDHDRHNGQGRANVVVDTKAPPGAILPGRVYKWPYEVTNNGSAPAKNVALMATPDRSLKVLALPPKCRWRRTGQLVCRIGLLPQGATKRGSITAEVAPKAPPGTSLANPVQVSWRNSPTPEMRSTAFPPVEVSPAGLGATTPTPETVNPGGRIPYEVMLTDHGPVTAEAVVVRSPVTAVPPDEPCGALIRAAKIPAGKTAPVKPAIATCEPAQDKAGAAQDSPASAPGKAVAPCGAVAEKPAAVPDTPVTPPCAAAQDKSAACLCGVAQDKPAAPPAADAAAGKPAAAPGVEAAGKPAAVSGKPAAAPVVTAEPGTTVAAPCGAVAEKPAAVPATPVTPPCAAAQGKPAVVPDTPVGAPGTAGAQQKTPAAPATVAVPGTPVAASCGAVSAQPMAAQGTPVTSPCAVAQGRPDACSCKAAQEKPAAAPATIAAPDRPAAASATAAPQDNPVVTPCTAQHDKPVAAPCGAAVQGKPAVVVPGAPEAAAPCMADADKPMAAPENAVPGKPVAPPCGAVQEKPVAAPDPVAPMTPLAGPGKVAHEPLSRPARVSAKRGHAEVRVHRSPALAGKHRRGCVTQGTGSICPLGSVPPGRTHMFKLAPARPEARPGRLRCAGTADENSVACHTRMARPVAARDNLTIRRLPTTGGSSALLALWGLGLGGVGLVLYRIGRARRGEQG
ncbi:MAG: hypothetical protein JWR24_2207 [Actinoallomurus sp.]|nr:hypothetical protein [Actinoallomurus sp.]